MAHAAIAAIVVIPIVLSICWIAFLIHRATQKTPVYLRAMPFSEAGRTRAAEHHLHRVKIAAEIEKIEHGRFERAMS